MSITNSNPLDIAKAASISARNVAVLSADARNAALTEIHQALSDARESILAANRKDLETASLAAAHGELSQSVLKRLDLGRKGKFDDMLQGILDVRALEDPGKSICTLFSFSKAYQRHGSYRMLHHSVDWIAVLVLESCFDRRTISL